MSDAVLLDVDEDGIATLTMNMPEKMNPVTGPVAEDLEAHLDSLATRSGVRCVVVEGKGGAFSAGGDIEAMHDRIESEISLDESAQEIERGLSEMMRKLIGCRYPTVAKVDGPAVGAGANLAIGCDVVLASESASIGFLFKQVGLSIDGGASYLLPRIVGMNVAKELVFTGEVLDAERAADLGLFNHVYEEGPFESEADALIDEIASGPTVAFRHAKHLIQGGFDKSLGDALHDEATAQGLVFETADHEEGVRAFLEDREPEFEGR